MKSKAKDLLLEIAHCPIVKGHFDGRVSNSCSTIVLSQEKEDLSAFQLPEPWNGDLGHAPILFLSSNPSVGESEKYPIWNKKWSDDQIVDFFAHRFSEREKPWVKNELYPLQVSGEYAKDWVRFWASVRARAKELLPDKEKIQPGIDYYYFVI